MIAYFDCFSGISGDMALGALVDAGLPLETLQEQLARLGLTGYRLAAHRRQDYGISGTRVEVLVDTASQPERRLAEIVSLLETSRLEPAVVARARAVFERLARAEARVHGVRPEEVHFHEVGAVDAIVDIVGVVAGLQALGVTRVFASSLPLGGGAVQTRHGLLPLPAPGTLEILAEVGAPTRPVATDRELVTPTGAALLAELATFEQPPLRIRRVGYGYGRHQLPWPNCARLWLGEHEQVVAIREELAVLETNLDDMTPEQLGYVMERLFAAGALDVYFQPLYMKKNRPGVLLGVIARPVQVATLAALVLAETSSLGVRVSRLERYAAERVERSVETPFGTLRVKVKRLADREVLAPEYEDAARLARASGVPLTEIYHAVYRATEAGKDNPHG